MRQINAINSICSKDNAALDIESVVPLQRSAGPIVMHRVDDNSVCLGLSKAIGSIFTVLRLAQLMHSVALLKSFEANRCDRQYFFKGQCSLCYRISSISQANARPILAYRVHDTSISPGTFNTIGSAFKVLHLTQETHSAALSMEHSGKSMP